VWEWVGDRVAGLSYCSGLPCGSVCCVEAMQSSAGRSAARPRSRLNIGIAAQAPHHPNPLSPPARPAPHLAAASAGAQTGSAAPARPEPSRAERRAAEALRAAYIAELEEREAARHSYARRNGGLAGNSAGWSALSFLPYLV